MNPQVYFTAQAPAPIGPYNQAIGFGGLLFVSGQIALLPDSGDLVTSTIEDETRQVMENLRAILQDAGTDFQHVLKCSIFVRNMDDYNRINEVYGSYFNHDSAPARELVEVAALPRNVNVEISCIAALDQGVSVTGNQ